MTSARSGLAKGIPPKPNKGIAGRFKPKNSEQLNLTERVVPHLKFPPVAQNQKKTQDFNRYSSRRGKREDGDIVQVEELSEEQDIQTGAPTSSRRTDIIN